MTAFIYKDETYELIKAALSVYNTLGPGFLEPVYQGAYEIELQHLQIPYEREKHLMILYRGIPLHKEYTADFFCYNKIIVELKAVKQLINEHESQVLNYLTATRTRLGLLINFGSSKLEYKRLIK